MAARKTYILKLYVAGNTPNSMRALNTLREILENEFKGVYALKVIDVLKQPQLAEEDKILATPTLAKILPPPNPQISKSIHFFLASSNNAFDNKLPCKSPETSPVLINIFLFIT